MYRFSGKKSLFDNDDQEECEEFYFEEDEKLLLAIAEKKKAERLARVQAWKQVFFISS